jgi:hypothetical protein
MEEITMAKKTQTTQKGDHPKHEGGANVKNAQQWGGGSKGAKGPVKRNPNTSSKG